MSTEYECIECGCQFIAEMLHSESEDQVMYCVNCGAELEDELDENFYEDEDDL